MIDHGGRVASSQGRERRDERGVNGALSSLLCSQCGEREWKGGRTRVRICAIMRERGAARENLGKIKRV
jgi:hypothetical protein